MTTLFLDLESVPEDATVGMDLDNPPGWEPEPPPPPRAVPSNYKDPAKIIAWEWNERERHAAELDGHAAAQAAKARDWYGRHSLDPMKLRIACIGYAYDDDEPEVLAYGVELGDRLVLTHFLDTLQSRHPNRVVAHGGRGFDFPVLQVRSLKHGLPALGRFFHQDKPYDGYLIDTHDWWPTTSYRGFNRSTARMDDICAFLGIERPNNPISGAGVLDAYVDGHMDNVMAHCWDDIRVLREVFRRLEEVRGE